VNTVVAPVDAEGAVLSVEIGLAAANVQQLRQAGKPVPPPRTVRALIDTGTDATCVDPQVLAPLIAAANLQPNRFLFSHMPAAGGMSPVSEYDVSLTLLHPSGNPRAHRIFRNHPVLEQSLGPLPYQALLGRDVLASCLLIYDGPSASFTLAF
jgi:hypothetical protein